MKGECSNNIPALIQTQLNYHTEFNIDDLDMYA